MKSFLIPLFVKFYGLIFKLGIWRIPGFRRLFLGAYELYKRRLEDSLEPLAAKHPHLFQEGHLLDVGANVGYTAFVLLRRRKDRFRVYAFEPEPSSFATLRDRFQGHEGIQLFPMAVGSETGSIQLTVNQLHPADHRVVGKAPNGEIGEDSQATVDVPMVTLDDWRTRTGLSGPIAFLKIDVQGYEFEVLKGAEHLIESNPRLSIYFEFDPQMLKSYGHQPTVILEWLGAKGFSLFEVSRGGELNPFRFPIQGDGDVPGRYWDLLAVRNQDSVAPRRPS